VLWHLEGAAEELASLFDALVKQPLELFEVFRSFFHEAVPC
jgi:hypothetical protein